MSHEIRTPMNGILGMAQMLLLPKLGEGERLEYARTVLDSGNTLLTLLNDILDLSKVEAGKIQLEASPFQPGQLIHETRFLFADAAGKKGLRLDGAWAGASEQSYLGDPSRLRQMLSNLVANAIKFTASGHVQIEARELERDGHSALLEFAVVDSGIGIARDKQWLLFEPFSQADNSTTRQFGGSGLGLSIVRSLAALMGGTVGVDSDNGQGSRFWFRIRVGLLAQTGDSLQTPRSSQPPAGLTLSQLSGRVLVVEDEPTNRRVIVALLKKLGLQVAIAEDGQQAVAAIAAGEAADLILMDLQMPVLDGYAATERIRLREAEQGGKRRIIIALTADAFEEDRQHCLAVGMDDFLTKPIDFTTLSAVLGRWFASSPVATVEAAKRLPVDVDRCIGILAELEPLLAQNKFDALSRLRELQKAVAGTDYAESGNEIRQLLEQFQFKAALESLRSMAKALAEEGKTA